jgi:peptidoglycan-associated lipoprotein
VTQRAWWLAATASLLACAHSSKTASASPAGAVTVAATPMEAARPEPRACSADDQCGATELCVASRCVAISEGLAECRATAHFGFDRAELDPSDLAPLQRVARCLGALSGGPARIEGNCDERGDAQYNVALGFRRAHAVGRYLEDLGVPAARLSEVSYGKERPVCTDDAEACWARTRRADVTHGGDASTP